jgi:hypothetical protein
MPSRHPSILKLDIANWLPPEEKTPAVAADVEAPALVSPAEPNQARLYVTKHKASLSRHGTRIQGRQRCREYPGRVGIEFPSLCPLLQDFRNHLDGL